LTFNKNQNNFNEQNQQNQSINNDFFIFKHTLNSKPLEKSKSQNNNSILLKNKDHFSEIYRESLDKNKYLEDFKSNNLNVKQ